MIVWLLVAEQGILTARVKLLPPFTEGKAGVIVIVDGFTKTFTTVGDD